MSQPPQLPRRPLPELDPDLEIASPATLSAIAEDLRVHTPTTPDAPVIKRILAPLAIILFSSGFHMMLAYRFGAFFHKYKVKPLCLLIEKFIFHWYHCMIPCSAKMGPGIWVPHPLGIVFSAQCRLGKHIRVRQHVEIVHAQPVDQGKTGIVADNVVLNTGAVLLRGAVIGQGSIVAARALVTKPVPPHHIAMGMPAKSSPLNSETPDQGNQVK